MSTQILRIITLVVAVLAAAPVHILADEDAPLKHANVSDDHIGIKGYDPVSYFAGAPLQGSEKLLVSRKGVVYRFASEENKKKFLVKPEAYVPAFGGWCATAMADGGRKVDIEPTSFKITGGRLFLFYKGWRGDALKDWNKDEVKNLRSADENWKRVIKE